MFAKRILALALLVWLVDAVSKWWAVTHLPRLALVVIPNTLYLWLGNNPGAAYGMGGEYMELCLTMPATFVFLVYLWLVKREKSGFHPSALMQIGIACLTGGCLSNWAERVIYQHVTDFCFTPLWGCLWNLADMFISGGFMLVAIDVFRQARANRSKARADATKAGA